jgi:hypothetical protein
MSFKVITNDGRTPHLAWFYTTEQLIASMLNNPTHNYHRIN